jgi:hypothetical protein
MEKNSKYLEDFKNSLMALDINALRNKASKNFGIKLTREHTKTDIVDLIVLSVSKATFAEEAEGELKPGFSRIKVLPIAGRVTFPIYLNCNGYFCFIPLDIPVDVPAKVVEVLSNALEMRKSQNEFGEYYDTLELSYPFQVLANNPGPDPRPGREVHTENKWKPYRRFYAKYGYWPNAEMMKQYIMNPHQFQSYPVGDEKAED